MQLPPKIEAALRAFPTILSLFDTKIFGRRIFPRRLFNVMFYTTNRCNSRCETCHIWQQQPKVDLPVEKIRDVLDSKSFSRLTLMMVEGGEFIMHPQCEEILEFLRGRFFGLMSNAILVDRLVGLVKKFEIREVAISLDGAKETYKKARGVDAYDNVVQAISTLKDITNVVVCFTFSPWNSPEDYYHVWRLCRDLGVRLTYNIYSDIEFFQVTKKPRSLGVKNNPDGSKIKNDYFNYYEKWLSGKLKLPCLSIKTNVVIYPNGDIPLCQHREIILGNLHERSFDKIWNDPKTIKLQKEHRNCNRCWVSYHRYWDLALVKTLDRLLPHQLVEKFVGEYRL